MGKVLRVLKQSNLKTKWTIAAHFLNLEKRKKMVKLGVDKK